MKSLKELTWALLACFVLSGMTACSDDDDDDNSSNSQEDVSLTVNYSLSWPESMLDIADIEVTYTSQSGSSVTETVSSSTWTKTVTGATTPFKASMQAKYTLKITPDEDTAYKVGVEYYITTATTTGKKQSTGNSSSMSIGGSKLEEYLESLSEKTYSTSVE